MCELRLHYNYIIMVSGEVVNTNWSMNTYWSMNELVDEYVQSFHFPRVIVILVGASGPVDTALDSRSEGLGFDSQCWPCVEVSGKLCIPHCLGPPSGNGYLVHRSKVGSIFTGCIGAHLARGKVESVEHALSWSLDSKQLPLPLLLLVFIYMNIIHGSVSALCC